MNYKEKLITLLNNKELSQEQKEKLETIFPELKESEDEQIRKEIKKDAEAWYKEHYEGSNPQGRSIVIGAYIDGALAWLEKQGEQKSAWSEEDEDALDIAIRIIQNGGDDCAGILDYDKALKWLKLLKDRVLPQPKQEQKPIIPKFRVGDKVVSIKNRRLTYKILEVGIINELGNLEYKVEIFTDGKQGILNKEHNIKNIEISRMDEWGELIEQKPIPKFTAGDRIRYRGEKYHIDSIEKTANGLIYNVSLIGKPSDPEEVKTSIGYAAEKDMEKVINLKNKKS
jgi:hypothetical protein